MNKSTIAALVFGGILLIIGIISVPQFAAQINAWLGRQPAEPPAVSELAAVETPADPAIEQPVADEAAGTPEPAAVQPEPVEATVDQPEIVQETPKEQQEQQEQQEQMLQETPKEQQEQVLQETEVAAVPENRAEEAAQVPPITVPTFGLLRVEPDGSTVIAGSAAANADIEILAGANKIASARSTANGDFVVVLDTPLLPGDYEIVLRVTEASGSVAMSEETAVISVPEKGKESELLALVEQPGAPSRLINTPQPTAVETADAEEVPSETASADTGKSETVQTEAAAVTDASEQETAEGIRPAQQPESVAEKAVEEQPADVEQTEVAALSPAAEKTAPAANETAIEVRIEAVEVDNGSVFVAGRAKPGTRVRIYANDILLGDTIASGAGRFLVQSNRDMPVGDYIIRADVIDSATAEVLARAAVPFTRNAEQRQAAVAVAEAPAGKSPPTVASEETEVAVVVPDSDTQLPASPPEVAAETPVITGKLRRSTSSVIIRRGDTLWQISRRVYGRGVKYTTIYLANQEQIADPDRIWPGQIFALPENASAEPESQTSAN